MSSFMIAVLLLVAYSDNVRSCHPCTNVEVQGPTFNRTVYLLSDEKLENPRRGFMSLAACGQAEPCGHLSTSYLTNRRHQDGITIISREYVLHSYKSSHISDTFLRELKTEMTNIREAGFTVIPRFVYTTTSGDNQDATLHWVLEHIKQLKIIFHEFHDVIDVVQAGFIGTWGEWHYSSHYGIPSTSHADLGLTSKQWSDRKAMLQALLDALPATIQVQVRRPAFKMHIWGDVHPTSLSEVHARSHKARTGHHNDCFLASQTDYGTYRDIHTEYPYLESDTHYCVMGGETCTPVSNRHHCTTATNEMAKFHWSYLNIDYDKHVYDIWKEEGCFDDAHRRLGYRFSLTYVVLPEFARVTDNMCYEISIRNTGYAAPFREMDVHLVMKAQTGGHYVAAKLQGVDVRTWLPGDHFIHGAIHIPPSLTPGVYNMYLTISDPSLSSRADYYVLLANVGVPSYTDGKNDLHRTIRIQAHSGSPHDDDCPHFSPWTPPTHAAHSRLYGPKDTSGHSAVHGTVSQACTKHTVPNYSFEHESDWTQYGTSGFKYTQTEAWDGHTSAQVTNGGFNQIFVFPNRVTKFIFSGYSKNSGVTGNANADYSVYCDIKHSDGTWTYGENSHFKTGNAGHSWHRAVLQVSSQKDIGEAWCYGLFRGHTQGTAYFDKFEMWILNVGTDFPACIM